MPKGIHSVEALSMDRRCFRDGQDASRDQRGEGVVWGCLDRDLVLGGLVGEALW